MSMYGDSSYNNEKNDLYGELRCFLEDHPISEMLQIVADVVKYEAENENDIPHETVTEFADRCRECGREKVLDKIKAEIEKISTNYCGGYIGLDKQEVLNIIENYKKE